MQLDGSFEAVVVTPAKELEAQPNERGVQSKAQIGQFRIRRAVVIKASCSAHEQLGNGFKQTPVPVMVGIGQISARESAPESHVIECGALGVQTGNDITQAFAIRKLPEAERQKVIVFTQSSRRSASGKIFETTCELLGIECVSDLGKDGRWTLHALQWARTTSADSAYTS